MPAFYERYRLCAPQSVAQRSDKGRQAAFRCRILSAIMTTIDGTTSEWIKVMNSVTKEFDQNDEDFFTFTVSDDALEAAARPTAGAAMSFPNAPTVSIVFACCGND
jgi:hypothetical protein